MNGEEEAMAENQNLTLSWARIGGVCGLLGVLMYVLAAFVPMPDILGYTAAFAFGPLVSVSAVGLYRVLAAHRDSPLLQIATMFAIAAGITVLLMLTTQQSIFGIMKSVAENAGDEPAKEQVKMLRQGLNSVHFGLDVAWDVLISTAVILLGISMMKHPAFGKILGGAGVILGGLLLAFNLYYFPTPPASVESIDWGPAVALWMVVTYVFLLKSTAWVKSKMQ